MKNNSSIYLDYAATTPVDPRIIQAMLPFFDVNFGNPSSIHSYGQQAEAALESSRETLAACLHCQPNEVIFTSCGSESDNLALRGAALAAREQRGANRILISPVEHHAVSHTAAQLAQVHGFKVEFLPVDQDGMVKPEDVVEHLDEDVALVSVIYANNEIGSINPIANIGEACRHLNIPFHTDAVQAAAYLPLDVESLNLDMMSIGAHKFYGPKGIGALYIRGGTPVIPSQTGGAQEFGMRAGTHNVPYVVGMAMALDFAHTEQNKRISRINPLRDHLIGQVLESIPNSRLTGHARLRLPNHASFVFDGVDGNTLLMQLDLAGFACSSGSACKTGSPEPSEVLVALGLSPRWSLGSLRITLGNGSTPEHIDALLNVLPHMVEANRKNRITT
jgi:cysteine desulfurase